MKAIVFSDIHFNNWQTHSHITEDGLNSRLVHTSNRMKDIIKLGEERKVDCLLFAGDWFHVKKIDAEVIDVAVRSLSNCRLPIIGTVGNHDLASYIQQTHSSRAMDGHIKFLDAYNGNSYDLGNGNKIYGIPYHTNILEIQKQIDKVPKDTKILLMHQGIKGAWLGEGFEGDTEDSIDPILLHNKAELSIVGHFHSSQYNMNGDTYKVTSAGEMNYTKYKTVLTPGAVEEHNWGDKGQERGCWYVDTDKCLMEFLPLSSPKFIEADEKTDQSLLQGNYVRWIGEKKNVPIGTISESFTIETSQPKMDASCHSFHLNPSDNIDKVLKTYIENSPMPGLDSKRLFQEGKRLIS